MEFGYPLTDRKWKGWYFNCRRINPSTYSYELSYKEDVVGKYVGPAREDGCDYELTQAIKSIDRKILRRNRNEYFSKKRS